MIVYCKDYSGYFGTPKSKEIRELIGFTLRLFDVRNVEFPGVSCWNELKTACEITCIHGKDTNQQSPDLIGKRIKGLKTYAKELLGSGYHFQKNN